MSYPSPYPIPRRIALSVGLLLVRWARRPAGPDSLTVDRSAATTATITTTATTARSARPAVVTSRAAAVASADHGAPAVATTDRGAPAVAATPAVVTADRGAPAAAMEDHTLPGPGAGQARETAPVTDAVSPNPTQHARAVADRERAIRQFEVDRQVAAERTRAEHRALSWPGHP
jgi:hypothetical protein